MTGELERAYRRTGSSLLGYIRKRVSDSEEAQDILHDTFVRAAGRIPSLSGMPASDGECTGDSSARTTARPTARTPIHHRVCNGTFWSCRYRL